MSSIRKRPEHILPAFSSLPTDTAAADTAAAAAVGVVADTAALEGVAAAATAAEAALEGAAAAEVAATAAVEAAVSGLDLSRSASEPHLASRGEMRTSLTPCAVASTECAGAFCCLSAATLEARGAKQFSRASLKSLEDTPKRRGAAASIAAPSPHASSRSRSLITVAAYHLPPVALAILRRVSSAAAFAPTSRQARPFPAAYTRPRRRLPWRCARCPPSSRRA
jgi:hypothetical protein